MKYLNGHNEHVLMIVIILPSVFLHKVGSNLNEKKNSL